MLLSACGCRAWVLQNFSVLAAEVALSLNRFGPLCRHEGDEQTPLSMQDIRVGLVTSQDVASLSTAFCVASQNVAFLSTALCVASQDLASLLPSSVVCVANSCI